jgi:Kef-type K+ transport system membrane component KefB
MIEIYFLIGLFFGIRFLYKEVKPSLGIGTSILLAPIVLLIGAFIWPLMWVSELKKK